MNNMFKRTLLSFVAVYLLCFAFSASSSAQDLDDVTISGKVVDSNGLPIVGATVTAMFTDTGVDRKVVTNEGGRYRLIELQPGIYSIKAEADGFGAKIKTDLETISGKNVQLDFKLDPASVVVEPVEVTSEDAPVIDTTRTIVGGTVTKREIEELPNTSNDVLDLVFTLGGVAEEPFSIRNLADDRRGDGELSEPSEVLGAGNFSLTGGQANSTNITIDGLDNNDDRSAEERFQPPPDAVAEVQVITNQFSAEYGRASGGRINIRTRAGARKFRGRFFMFFEDDNLNANSYNNNRRSLSRLPFTEYNPGGTLSGPIPFWYFKNKTYFFSSYSYRDRDATTQIFTALPVEQNPRFPLPMPTGTSRPDTNDPNSPQIAQYSAIVDTPARRHRFTQRIDHNFTDKHNITFNYQFGRSDSFRQYRETTRFLEETLQGRVRDNDSFYITDNFVFTPNVVNQFRFQYSSYRPDFATQNPNQPVVLLFVRDETLSNTDPNRVRGTVVAGNSTSNFAGLREETRYQFQETLTFVLGNHNFRVGADVQTIESENKELFDTTGTYNYDVEDFLNNTPNRFRLNLDTGSSLKNTYYGLFVQDDWHIRPNLMLSFGLRYERETILGDKNNLGPRLALAFSPGDSGKSVIRFGAGIFYNRTLLRTVDDFRVDFSARNFDSNRLNGPSGFTCTDQPMDTSDKCTFLRFIGDNFPNGITEDQIRSIPGIADIDRGFVGANVDPNIPLNEQLTRQLEPGIKIPESYQFNIGYERDIGKDFAFEVNYTYNKAVRLWREQNINRHIVPAGFSTFTEYLLSLGDVTLGNNTFRFVLGDPTDPNGDTDASNGDDCDSGTALCIVNLNTLNGSGSGIEPIGIALRVLDATLNRPVTNNFRQLEQVGSRGQSAYQGLAFELRRRFRDLGFGFRSSMRFSYVLSRTRDDGFVDTSNAQVQGDFQSDFARSSTDRRHKFRFSGTFETPYWVGKLRLSPLLRLESGRPFNISGGGDRNLDDVSNDRPNYTGDLSDIVYQGPNDPFPQALFNNFSLNPIGTPSGGNLLRNAGSGPALFIFDLNVSRQFKFNERFRIRPQISFDNILNAKIFSFGSDFINFANNVTGGDQGFLVPTRTLRPRQIQLGIRIDF